MQTKQDAIAREPIVPARHRWTLVGAQGHFVELSFRPSGIEAGVMLSILEELRLMGLEFRYLWYPDVEGNGPIRVFAQKTGQYLEMFRATVYVPPDFDPLFNSHLRQPE